MSASVPLNSAEEFGLSVALGVCSGLFSILFDLCSYLFFLFSTQLLSDARGGLFDVVTPVIDTVPVMEVANCLCCW